jgi:hypothetical protein
MGPSRERADEEQNQDNEEYRSEHNRLRLENNAGVLTDDAKIYPSLATSRGRVKFRRTHLRSVGFPT